MRFGVVHRVLTDALAALGVLALVASGRFSRTLDAIVIVALVIAIALKEPWRQRASQLHLDAIGTAILAAVQLTRGVVAHASVIDLLVEFAVGLQIVRVATRHGAAHDHQLIVLALLHLIAGTVVGGGLGYGLCFLGLVVVTPGALVLSHLRREVEGNYRQGARDRTGLPVDVPRILRSKRVVGGPFVTVVALISLPILIVTGAVFLFFPRVGLSLLLLNKPRGERMIGFSGKVNLGQIGTLRSDPTIALRVMIPDLPTPPPPRLLMHLRGTALDRYDGRTWTQSTRTSRPIASAGELVPISGFPAPGDRPWTIELEPFEPSVLFLSPTTRAIELTQSGTVTPGLAPLLLAGPEGEFRYQMPGDREVRYALYPAELGRAAFSPLPPTDRARYLQLPESVSDRVRSLALEWTRGASDDVQRARRVEEHLRNDFAYDLESPSGGEDRPLDHFLFESKRGHCEYFSTAMAVMLRSLSIPARNVTGFVGGTYNRYGHFYAVRQGDAHSWVEAYVEDRGWLTFDPTPPGAAAPMSEIDGALARLRDFFEATSQRWNRHVLGYDLTQQTRIFGALDVGEGSDLGSWSTHRWWLGGAVGGAALLTIGLGWALRRRTRRAPDRSPEVEPQKDALAAARLYRLLDRAMTGLDLRRLDSVPPLRHALALERSGHPLGPEVRALTERYLEARYGARPLKDAELRDFERRTRVLARFTQGDDRTRQQGSTETPRPVATTTAPYATEPMPALRRSPLFEPPPIPTFDSDAGEHTAVVPEEDLVSTHAPPVRPGPPPSRDPRKPS